MVELAFDRYLQERAEPVRVTRSRPYHSDDNAHVEQKNWMWPRQLLGYGRLEEAALVEPINRLYKEVWGPLHNFFLPSMKLVRKWREGSRWRRRHDVAQTAYQRLLKMEPCPPKSGGNCANNIRAWTVWVARAIGARLEAHSEAGDNRAEKSGLNMGRLRR